jgi:nitroreductase
MSQPAVNQDADARELPMPVGEALFTQRSIRRMRPDPIPVEHLRLVVAAAAQAPTSLHPDDYGEFRAIFGVPEGIGFHLAIPLGYPRGRFGPTSRLPTAETTHWNQWGGAVPWA